jgi:[acyl-carrier-protein] S-malonyltransferase
MKIWIFPGQPLRFALENPDDEDFQAVDRLCRQRCGYDLINQQPLPGHDLSHHTCLQIYGVASSLYRARQLRGEGIVPDLVAEHSLGVYAALASCGSIDEGDALELACRIGVCMSRMGVREYVLGCPIGLGRDPVEAAARNNGVFVANYNTSSHFLLAGESGGIVAALAECLAAGAFSVSSIPCEAPLHTPLMAELHDQLTVIAAEYRFGEPLVPLIEHICQTRLTAATIPAFLVDELQQPVFWEQSWKVLRAAGFSRCCEVGSGQSLTKFNRWIDSEEN